MTTPPIHVTILRKGDSLLLDLDEVGALIPRSETQVDAAFLQELTTAVLRIATPGYGRRDSAPGSASPFVANAGTTLRALQQIGGLIFSHLFTEAARERLRETKTGDLYLRLDEQLIQIPWELGFDGEHFLATKFRVARQVITGAPVFRNGAAPEQTQSLKILLIVDPTETLPEAEQEAKLLCALLDTLPQVEVTLLGGRYVQKISLLAELAEHDLVHFAGHSYYDPQTPSKSGWRLHEGILTAEELSKCRHPPQLVFSNSCQAAVTAAWRETATYTGQTFGLGSAFLLAGVKNYIGTFWLVDDAESRRFATIFYQQLLSGASLGSALLAARHSLIQEQGWDSLTWASYVLYGDPTYTLISAEQLPSRAFLSVNQDDVPSPAAAIVVTPPTTIPTTQPNLETSVTPQYRKRRFRHFFLWAASLGLLVLGVSWLFFAASPLSLWQRSAFLPSHSDRPLPLPDKPSLVVLPFTNLSPDPEQEYFSDGMTEDLITDLSKLSNLFVIARNSAFSYKGKTATPEQISHELGVRYLLTGSVRKADERVRITAQLVDATTNASLWAERYDRPWHDIFALQDDISRHIVAALQVRIAPDEQQRLTTIPTGNLEAYDYVLRGWALYGRLTERAIVQARQLFAQATQLDPHYAEAYAALSATYLLEWTWQWQQTPQTLEQALFLAQKAIALNDSLSPAHMILGNVYLWKKEYERAVAAAERAIALDPNDAEGYATLAEIFTWVGKPTEAIAWVQQAIRLNPRATTSYLWILGHAYRLAGQYEAAITVQREVIQASPMHLGAHIEVAVNASELGRAAEARAEVANILRMNPQTSLTSLRQSLPYKDPAIRERLLAHLSKAGLR
ncbi:MAG: CHAT domain-containing protein [Candidatus Binatia bacterium]